MADREWIIDFLEDSGWAGVENWDDYTLENAWYLQVSGANVGSNVSADLVNNMASLLQSGVDPTQVRDAATMPSTSTDDPWVQVYDHASGTYTWQMNPLYSASESLSAYDEWSMGFQESQAAQQQANWAQELALQQQQLAQQAAQAAASIAQRQAELAEQRRQWDTLSAYQKRQVELAEAELEQARYEFEKTYGLQVEQFQWERDWAMAQSPVGPQPTGFAGWDQMYDWSPHAYIETGEGWLTAPMTYQQMNDPGVYGSKAWAENPANWWDVSRVNQTLEQQNRADDMNYTGFVPTLVANYFQGIEPWQYARNIEATQPGGMSWDWEAMPALWDLNSYTDNEKAQIWAAAEAFGYDPQDIARNAFENAPPEQRRTTVLY